MGQQHTASNRKLRSKRETYTPDELAEILGLGRTLVYANLKSGKIPAIRIGNRFVIPRSGIAEWLKSSGGGQAA